MSKKIAVLGLKRIGDAIYTLPLIEALSQHFGGRLDVFTQPHVRDIYIENPNIETVFSFSKQDFWSSTLNELKVGQYDICIVLHSSFKYALLPFLARIPVRVGYQKEFRGWMLTHSIPLPKVVIHRMEHNAALGNLIGVDSTEYLPKIYFSDKETSLIDPLLERFQLQKKGYIAFIVGSNAVSRRWFPENFADVAKQVYQQYGLKTCILGGKDDIEIAQEVINVLGDDADYIQSIAGKTSLRETMYLFKEAKALVTNDTGPMHVASTIGIPLVTWFGPTIENEVGPPSKNTIVLNSTAEFDKGVKDHSKKNAIESLKNITPELVLLTLDDVLR